ncbi:transcriptional regulator, AraC family [Fibrisoma limi BUZ 3]|uniref:Transcriptional regulator, AraC family n=1 Tax=Fibrisoma limi BUZ 3 TaxID=1185876 RepID=I2GT61_9BACT|nr:helix-turn-helix transcriptional regulator [Fibrisoma limi]CCH57090.1 transcriptional regulator, AraC family [Fibrisoma limi BUZ 3]
MTLPPLDLILLLGSVQGFILAVLLWTSRKGNRVSNRLLARLIGILALASLAVGNPSSNVWVRHAIDLLPFFIIMPVGPIIYFYVQSVLNPEFRLGSRERRHFYPMLLDCGAPLMGWTFIIGALLGVFNPKDGPNWGYVMDEYNAYVDIPRWISCTIYLVLTHRFLARQSAGPASETEGQRRRWLRQLVNVFLGFQVIWLLHLIPYIVPAWRDPLLDQLDWYPIYIPITIMIYWLGLRGYLHARISAADITIRKPSTASIPAETVAKTAYSLKTAMETDKLYLDPELTVEKLARHVQLPPKIISSVLNQKLQKSFNSFVNEYRIEAVKQRLTNSASEHLTLTGIAFECGFNSQATFQRTFKQMTGVSPKEYIGRQTTAGSA